MTAEEAEVLARKLIRFLETGVCPDDLLTEDVFCDFTPPLWRLQAEGRDAVVGLRLQGHPSAGRVPRWRCDPTPSGFVLEFEETSTQDGQGWYCREMLRADVRGARIAALSVDCTGDWNATRVRQHHETVSLLRP
jgi:hypothetical protein